MLTITVRLVLLSKSNDWELFTNKLKDAFRYAILGSIKNVWVLSITSNSIVPLKPKLASNTWASGVSHLTTVMGALCSLILPTSVDSTKYGCVLCSVNTTINCDVVDTMLLLYRISLVYISYAWIDTVTGIEMSYISLIVSYDTVGQILPLGCTWKYWSLGSTRPTKIKTVYSIT